VKPILLSDLLLDPENPRLPEQASQVTNQVSIIEAMVKAQGKKLTALATSIVSNGYNPSELPIVVPVVGTKQFTVMEGNRRVTALKLLSTPSLLPNSTSRAVARAIRELSKKYLTTPVNSLACAVYETREEAYPWVELRHNGERGGAGIVPWGSRERDAFAARRSGKKSPQLQVLDLVIQAGRLSPEAVEKLPDIAITNLGRLIGTAHVKTKLGIAVEKDGTVTTKFNEEEVINGLTRLVNDVILNLSVNDIRSVEDRRAYIDKFDDEDLPDKTNGGVIARPISTPAPRAAVGNASTPASAQPRKKSNPPSTTRLTIIPADCVLAIAEVKPNNIYHELKTLKIATYTNAGAVLFRVFLELSIDRYLKDTTVDTYIQQKQISITDFTPLKDKLGYVSDFLEKSGLMDKEQVTPFRRAARRNGFLATSISSFNAYVHSAYDLPHLNDLKIAWDEFRPLLELIWA